jgi:hypothetical protein
MAYLTNQYDRGVSSVALVALRTVADLLVIKFTDPMFADGKVS